MVEKFDTWYKKKYQKSEIYQGVKIEGILFEEYWHQDYRASYMHKFKNILKIIFGVIGNFFPTGIEKNFEFSENKKKIFFILSFGIGHQNKIGEILDGLKKEFLKSEIILIVFDKKEYNLQKEKYNTIYIYIPKFFTNLRHKKLTKWKFLPTLSRQLKILEIGKYLIENLKPSLVVTTQDFYLNDYIFTMLAKKNGILTLTHLHGMIIKENVGAYKYYYSDYIMLWGKRDVDILKQYLDQKGLIAVGADKFKNIMSTKDKEKKYLVLCMTNLPNFSEHEIEIIKEFKNIQFQGKKVIKIHPSINLKKFKKKYSQFLNDEVIASSDYKYIEGAKYLITYRTTALLDGMISGASVVEICFNTNELKRELSEKIPENLKNYKEVKLEIEKREKNKKYFQLIIEKQEKYLEYAIESFESSKKTKKIIDELLHLKEINRNEMG